MEKTELAVLVSVLVGILSLSIGSVLYARKLMAEYGVSWELQLAFFGLTMIVVSLTVSKILSKANG